MKLQFTIAEDDVLVFSQRYYDSSSTHQKSKRNARIMVPLILLPLAAIYTYQFGFSIAPMIVYAIGIIGWLICYPTFHDFRLRSHIRKQMKEPAFANMFGEYSIDFDDSSLRSTGPAGEATTKWDGVHRVELTDDYLFIFLSGPSGFLIPTRQVGAAVAQEAYDEIERIRRS